jgi:hypothetical protein
MRKVHSLTGFPLPAFVPPSAFLTLSTAFSSSHLAGLFHPPTTSEIHSSGVCPRQSAESTHRRPVPSCRSRRSPTVELPQPHQIPTLALQGLHPTTGPLPLTGGLDLPTPRSPLKFSLPRAFLQTPWRYPRSPSAHDLSRRFLV